MNPIGNNPFCSSDVIREGDAMSISIEAPPGPDPHAALRAKIAAARTIVIDMSAAEKEEAALLAELRAEGERVKAEQRAHHELIMSRERFNAGNRIPGVPLDSTIIEGAGPIVVRCPTADVSRKLTDGIKAGNADAAEMTFALACLEYPPKEAAKAMFVDFPFVSKTIVDMATKLGGLQAEADRKSRG